MSEALLQVSGLQTGYGRVPVLWQVDLEVHAQEIVALVGANGAGKTTCLRAISGLLPAWSGEVRWQGRDLTRVPAPRRVHLGISQVPEGRQLFPALSVEDNLDLGAAFVPGAWARRDEQRRQVFALFPRLEERARQKAGTLSGGEQQMLAIGRALMASPALLLVDEPSLGLAPTLMQAVFRALAAVREHGTPVLLVEQNIRQSLRLADRAYVLENGRIALAGTGRDLLASPHVQRAYLGV